MLLHFSLVLWVWFRVGGLRIRAQTVPASVEGMGGHDEDCYSQCQAVPEPHGSRSRTCDDRFRLHEHSWRADVAGHNRVVENS